MRKLPDSFFSSVIGNARSVVWVISRDADRVLFINRDFCGHSAEEILESGLSPVWHHMDMKELNEILAGFEAARQGKFTENIQASHRNGLTGEMECYMHSVYPLRDPGSAASFIQVTSRDITPLLRARKTMEILNTVNVTVQRNIFARNLFALVGRRLAENGLFLVIFTFQEREKLRLEYANIPKRRLKKLLSRLHIQGPPYEFPFERFPTAKQAMLRRKAIFFKSSLEYLKSRMQKREDVAHIAELARLLGPGKIIIAPMVVDRRSIGIFFMTSESLSTIDLKTVNALAVQFAHVIVHRQIHSDAEKLKRHLDVLLDSVEEAVFTTDLKGKVVSWNRASRELFGHTKGDIIGAGVSTLGIDKGLWTECMEACRQGAAKRVAGIPLTCIHGSRTANIRTFPTDSGRDRGVVFVVSPSPAGDRKPPQ